jgi:hypothetical protein
MKKLVKTILGRQTKNRSKYNPSKCKKTKEKVRRKKQIENGILNV